MTRVILILTSLLWLFSAATVPAIAGSKDTADIFTVSGRYDLPKAKASLQSKMTAVSAIDVDDQAFIDAAKILKIKPEKLKGFLDEAFNKSLRNYQFVSSEDAGENVNQLSYTFSGFEFDAEDDGQVGTVQLDVTSSSMSCLTVSSKAKFKALKLKDVEKDRKAFAFLGAVVATAINPYSFDQYFFLENQIGEASILNKISNYGVDTAIGEGYPSGTSEKKAKRYALSNAMRLSFARYMLTINEKCP